jgi:predicted DCC family thiol-disulfide oxidoreductase YuxK
VAVVLFDGVCNLCNGIVRFVIARDPDAHFQFAPITSGAAARLLDGVASPDSRLDSLILIDNGRVFTRSDAALRIARCLTFPWPVAYGLVILPRAWRDAAYDFIARRRYRWFGRRETCMAPSPAIRARFLD